MSTALLAVILVMALLIGFVLIILRGLAVAAGARVRADMLKLLASYDQIIDEKSGQIQQLQKEQVRCVQSLSAAAPPEPAVVSVAASSAAVPTAVSYRPGAFTGGYDAIRTHFRLSRQERDALLDQVADQATMGAGRGFAAAQLREALSFETVFRLSQMPPHEQLELLDTTLHDNDWMLLRDFCEQRPQDVFSTARFCDWLDVCATLESDQLNVRCGDRLVSETENMAYCEQICEGIQIVAGNRIYDYSIKEREIS